MHTASTHTNISAVVALSGKQLSIEMMCDVVFRFIARFNCVFTQIFLANFGGNFSLFFSSNEFPYHEKMYNNTERTFMFTLRFSMCTKCRLYGQHKCSHTTCNSIGAIRSHRHSPLNSGNANRTNQQPSHVNTQYDHSVQ